MEIRPTYLLMVTANNNNKYYNCFPEGDQFRVEYGRVDSTKTVLHYPMSKWNTTITSKIKKGYKDVTDLKKDLVQEKVQNDATYKQIENVSIRDIVEQLQKMAKETIKKHYTVSASAVTQAMVDEAQKLIDSMIACARSIDAFNKILLQLYTVIPRKMNHVDEQLAKHKDDFGKIVQREQDLLDVMRGQIYVPEQQTEASDVEASEQTILDANGLIFEEVSSDEIELIKVLMNESAGKFKKAWKITNTKTQNRYDEFIKNNDIKHTKLLFHGSRNENFWSIIKNGLMLRPINVVITGKMFGKGIYFAPKCQKSIGYTSLNGSYWAGGHSNTAYMALFEIAYGTPYDVNSHDPKYYDFDYDKLQAAKKGANCLHAHASKGMLHNDEIVVYKEEQMTIKYLIEIGQG